MIAIIIQREQPVTQTFTSTEPSSPPPMATDVSVPRANLTGEKDRHNFFPTIGMCDSRRGEDLNASRRTAVVRKMSTTSLLQYLYNFRAFRVDVITIASYNYRPVEDYRLKCTRLSTFSTT